MVFKRPGNNRDDRPKRPAGASKSGDNRRSSSNRGKDSKDADKSYNKTSGKRYGSGPATERSSFSSGAADKKDFAPRKPYSGRPADGDDKPKRSYGEQAGARGGKSKPYSGRPSFDSDRPAKKSFGGDRPAKRGFEGDDRPKRSFEGDAPKGRKFAGSKPDGDFKRTGSDFKRTGGGDFKKREGDKPFRKTYDKPARQFRDEDGPKKPTLRPKRSSPKKVEDDNLIRLNRYIANAGICSRRKADELITAGVVSVNGVIVNELGLKVDPSKDEIRYNGETLKREKNVYVLLNKPKDYITTTDDPQERRTVMHLVEKASRERIYPIGRLDRNTTGLLLMTNDGDLADKLSHPRSNITKIYQVELSKSLTQGDLNKLQFGVELEDGVIKPDSVQYVTGGTKKEIGVQIHSGKNRIVRRMFEHLGYEVVKLDRVVYANLTKKDLPRGRWRYLDEKEIIQLKHLIK